MCFLLWSTPHAVALPPCGVARQNTLNTFLPSSFDAFDKKRTKEQNFEIGRVKFKLSFKDGLKFFIENGVVELDAKDMARFLYENSEELDKTQIGEVLGKEIDAAFVKGEDVDADKGGSGFYLRVLYHYVDNMEFTGLMFDDAIRIFLSGFRLPGEAQKVSLIAQLTTVFLFSFDSSFLLINFL